MLFNSGTIRSIFDCYHLYNYNRNSFLVQPMWRDLDLINHQMEITFLFQFRFWRKATLGKMKKYQSILLGWYHSVAIDL